MSQVELTTFPQQSLDTSGGHHSEEWPRESNVSTHSRPSLEQRPEPPAPLQEFSLPPADGGIDAWLFLAASFVVEALVWGKFKFSTPVRMSKFLLTYIQDFHTLLACSKNTIPLMNHSREQVISHSSAHVH